MNYECPAGAVRSVVGWEAGKQTTDYSINESLRLDHTPKHSALTSQRLFFIGESLKPLREL